MFRISRFKIMVFRDYHIDGLWNHFKIEGRVGQVFAFGFECEAVSRNGHNPDFLATERADFLHFIDERTIINLGDVGGKFRYAHLADSGDVKQPVVGNGLGHHHHAAAVVTAVAHREAEDFFVENQLVIHSQLDMDAVVLEQAFCHIEHVSRSASLALRFHYVCGFGRRHSGNNALAGCRGCNMSPCRCRA